MGLVRSLSTIIMRRQRQSYELCTCLLNKMQQKAIFAILCRDMTRCPLKIRSDIDIAFKARLYGREIRKIRLAETSSKPYVCLRRMYSSEAVQGKSSRDFFSYSPVPDAVRDARSKTVMRIQDAVQNTLGQQYTLECFGSTRIGADCADSDVDIVILDPNMMNGFTPDINTKKLPRSVSACFKVNELLPNLQENIPPLPDKPTSVIEGGFWKRLKGKDVRCNYQFNYSPAWTPPPDIDDIVFQEALREWFSYWSDQFKYSLDIVNIREGGMVRRSEKAAFLQAGGDEVENKLQKSKSKSHSAGANKGSPANVDDPVEVILDMVKPVSSSNISTPLAEKSGLSGLHANLQQKEWQFETLVVADPFIPGKNTAGSIKPEVIDIFRAECRRAALLLDTGCTFAQLLGDGGLLKMSQNINQDIPEAVLDARSRTIMRVQKAVQKTIGQQYTFECFGSTCIGVDSAASDLDVVILDPKMMNGFTPDIDMKHLPNIYNVKALGRCLKKAGFSVTRVIPNAAVPIVKLKDPQTCINCDINVNDQLGHFNTVMITKYCELSPLLRPMLVACKMWAKSFGLNNPSGYNETRTFSSYALMLMTIAFFQVNVLLPNLQANISSSPDTPALTAEGYFWKRPGKGNAVWCNYHFNSVPSVQFYHLCEVLDTVYSHGSYWSDQFKYSLDIVSIREGGVVRRSEKAKISTP
ncbi:hypothetical protein EW145_g3686 [Phellinidium pouzarii]|uniref:Poly(A) RNA polymerase mitochondrial-like central palm domain-containing protein n=1 Tax=Phellinidium pouzarii TaxID=167371 RepID=A0A4S4L7Q4_9AGAM|nr:hypothetical protein EW145_g3686 [Phellinidium pouzarii]